LDANQKPFPRGAILFEEKPFNLNITPVIYIKNVVMLNQNLDLNDLSEKIINFRNQINKKNEIETDEIQIDCDWTLKSRDNYMKFISIFKKKCGQKLSVTIRLHQIKYFSKTGIPAADCGVLMYYNMGTIAADSMNSVYDRRIAQKYLSALRKYPMDLDIALPVFSQGVQISNKKVVNLIPKVDAESFENDNNFIVAEGKNIAVKNSNFKFGFYFKQTDEIKIETIKFDDLKKAAEDLNENMTRKPQQIIFFDLDSANIKKYDHENQNFEKITHYF
jgi:hypothetical protein